jgi:signal transduction histidine kinase
MLDMTPINLNTVIANIEMMLRRLIGENITLITQLSPDLNPVTADFGQMEQIIMNLAVNARDAMPTGGTLYLKTANAVIDAGIARQMEHAVPGEFVRLSVEDTGFGMDPETLDKIFDPFFSSKAPGQGTGLGLSVVYGVVTQHHGWISVYSEPDQGTRFHIYLPVSQEASLP